MTFPLRVLIADDSMTARQWIAHMIDSTTGMRVVAEAHNGRQAVQMTRLLRPDVILIDIVMPSMNGLDATREIMSELPISIVIITASLESQETDIAFQAVHVGTLSVIKKPVGPKDPEYRKQSDKLVNTFRAIAGVRVIHHRKTVHLPASSEPLPVPVGQTRPEIMAIVSSTGGHAALSAILKELPRDFDLPVVIVQHVSSEFMPSLVEHVPLV